MSAATIARMYGGEGYERPRMTLGEARAIAGSLGFPSKMPGTSYGLPATACIAGSKLAAIPGTVCHSCYVLVGRTSYRQPNAKKGMARRLASITDTRWVDAMVTLLSRTHAGPIKVDLGLVGVRLQRKGGSRHRYNEPGFHRWHDSGDLQSTDHLRKICEVAARTPTIRHWLPTNELSMVKVFVLNGGVIPENLTIRVSSIMIDDPARRDWPQTSSVFTGAPPLNAHRCPAADQGHRCMDCRACWSRTAAHVAYEVH